MKYFSIQKNKSYKEFRCTDTIIDLPDTVIPGNLESILGKNRVALFPFLLTESTKIEPESYVCCVSLSEGYQQQLVFVNFSLLSKTCNIYVLIDNYIFMADYLVKFLFLDLS